MIKLGPNVVEAPKFLEMSKELGIKLLAPLNGRCFNHNEDIWLYKFCVGDKVEQFHVEANGTYSEEFLLGSSTMS